MSKIVDGLLYSEDHEWVKVEGDIATIGITDHAQDQLGEIVYVELPDEGDEISAGDEIGAIESVKAASDLIIPVSGVITESNENLDDSPESINEDAYSSWIVKVKLSDASEVDSLMDAAKYKAFSQE